MKNCAHEKRRYPLDLPAGGQEGILENLFDDFLRFFFPDADKLFDMKKEFQFLDKELEQLFPTPENIQAPKFVDKPAFAGRQADKSIH